MKKKKDIFVYHGTSPENYNNIMKTGKMDPMSNLTTHHYEGSSLYSYFTTDKKYAQTFGKKLIKLNVKDYKYRLIKDSKNKLDGGQVYVTRRGKTLNLNKKDIRTKSILKSFGSK